MTPTCPACGEPMCEVGSFVYECSHGTRPPLRHPDLPRERRCDGCGERHTLPGPCQQPAMGHERRAMSAPWGGLVPLPQRWPMGSMRSKTSSGRRRR